MRRVLWDKIFWQGYKGYIFMNGFWKPLLNSSKFDFIFAQANWQCSIQGIRSPGFITIQHAYLVPMWL